MLARYGQRQQSKRFSNGLAGPLLASHPKIPEENGLISWKLRDFHYDIETPEIVICQNPDIA